VSAAKQGSRAWVLVLFPLCALAMLALNSLVSKLNSLGGPHRDGTSVLDFTTIAQMLLHNPGIYFTASLLLAGYLVVGFELLPGRFRFSGIRVSLGSALSAVIYPLAMGAMLVVALPLMSRPGGRNSLDDPTPLPPWRELLADLAPWLALVVGGVVTVLLLALAFRIATCTKPRHLWPWMLVVTIGAPALTLLFAYARVWAAGPPGAAAPASLSPLDHLLEPMIQRVPLLFIIGELLLATAAGSWLFSAAEAAAASKE